MKSILKRIGAIIRSAMSSVAHAVLVPVRLADGALGYVWKAIAGGTPPLAVEDVEEVVADERTPDQPAPDDTDRYREIGLVVQRNARALREHRKIPMDDVGSWLRRQSEPAILALLEADPVAVGRHMCGVETLVTEHNIRISRPSPEDRKIVERRLDADRRRMLREDDRRVKRERQAPSLLPSLAPGF